MQSCPAAYADGEKSAPPNCSPINVMVVVLEIWMFIGEKLVTEGSGLAPFKREHRMTVVNKRRTSEKHRGAGRRTGAETAACQGGAQGCTTHGSMKLKQGLTDGCAASAYRLPLDPRAGLRQPLWQ